MRRLIPKNYFSESHSVCLQDASFYSENYSELCVIKIVILTSSETLELKLCHPQLKGVNQPFSFQQTSRFYQKFNIKNFELIFAVVFLVNIMFAGYDIFFAAFTLKIFSQQPLYLQQITAFTAILVLVTIFSVEITTRDSQPE